MPTPRPMFRPSLNRDFAVLLMRSSYATLDSFDVVGMDQFQRDFFLIRSSGYEDYTKYAPNTQGDLTDPSYFDYISFAQYTTIARCLSQPSRIIEESQPVLPGDADFDASSSTTQFRRVVLPMRADLSGEDLFEAHSVAVGDALLTFLEDTYGGTPGMIPDGPRVFYAVEQLCKLFQVQGYAVSVSAAEKDGGISVEVEGSAVEWGSECLKGERIDNNFIAKAVEALFRRRGVRFRRVKQTPKRMVWKVT